MARVLKFRFGVFGMRMSGSLIQVLQVKPMLGRLIAESDDYRGCGDRGAVIRNAFWMREFGGLIKRIVT